jgi:nucleoid-associated protein YgaU
MSRYNTRTKATNTNDLYEKMFEKRGIKKIIQYRTPKLRYPSDEEKSSISAIRYTWKIGDMFWRLAEKYYGDPKMWWVIAQYNKKPTEAHLEIGDEIEIPLDLSRVLGVLT